ncbi:MAG: TonB family protein [Pseudomonadota bacterium]
MRTATIFSVVLAVIMSITAHLFLLHLFMGPPPTVLVEGGVMKVGVGMNSVDSVESAAGAAQPVAENEQPTEQPVEEATPEDSALSTEPAESPPATTDDNQNPETSSLPVDQAPETDTSVEPEPDPTPEPEFEPEPAPEPAQPSPPEPIQEPTQSEEKAPDLSEETASTAAPEGGAPSAPSLASGQEDLEETTTAEKEGNAESASYSGEVMEHLSRVRRPRAVTAGSALVAFTIAPSGEIESIRIAKSSGSTKFDREAMRMVKGAAPFPKPPAGVNREFVVEIEGR